MKDKKAALCVEIPLFVIIGLLIAFCISSALEIPTNRGIVYSILAKVALIGSMLVPIPCIASSIVGIISAAALRKQGEKTEYLILIGIINIAISLVIGLFWLYVVVAGV